MKTLFETLTAIFLVFIAAVHAVWLWAAWKVAIDGVTIPTWWPIAMLGTSAVLAVGLLVGLRGPIRTTEAPISLDTTRDVQRKPPLKFTVKQGKRYKAQISLGFFEQQVATNEMISGMFQKAGFADVTVSGNGAIRFAEGRWSGADTLAEMPSQIVSATEIAEGPTTPATSTVA